MPLHQLLDGGKSGRKISPLQEAVDLRRRSLVAGMVPAGQLPCGAFAHPHRVGEGARPSQVHQDAFHVRGKVHDLVGGLVVGDPVQQGEQVGQFQYRQRRRVLHVLEKLPVEGACELGGGVGPPFLEGVEVGGGVLGP